MKLGVCTDISNARVVKSSGFSELELSCGYISSLVDTDVVKLKGELDKIDISVSAVNCLMSGTKATLFSDTDLSVSLNYLVELFRKLALLNVKIVVFGSGGYRNVPIGVTSEQARERLSVFLAMLSRVAMEHSITVVIEPLNRLECNILNTTSECMEYIMDLNIPSLRLLVDYYHFSLENEPIENIYRFKEYISHLHIANPTGRRFMFIGDGRDYSGFFKAIKDIDATLSLEGVSDDFEKDLDNACKFYVKYL